MFKNYLKAASRNGDEIVDKLLEINWAETSIGEIETWPKSLKSSLSICLGSDFPSCIYWGKSSIYFYNQAFKSFVGEKHPWALGKEVKDVWPEVWGKLADILKDVFKGFNNKSQSEPFYLKRSLSLEETHFSYNFTPIVGDLGEIEGAFIAAIEITNQVLHTRRNNLLQKLFNQKYANNSIEYLAKNSTTILNRLPQDIPFFIVVIKANNMPYIISSSGITDKGLKIANNIFPFTKVDKTQNTELIELESEFSETISSPYEEKPTQALIIPFLNDAKNCEGYLVAGISSRLPLDVDYFNFLTTIGYHLSSAFYNVRAQEEKTKAINQMRGVFNQSPVAIAMFSGPQHKIEIANNMVLEIWGRKAKDVLNKPLYDALPEIKGTFFEPIISKVYETGERFSANEFPITFKRAGELKNAYLNFVYEPLRETDGSVSAIIMVATEITDAVKAKKDAQQNSTQLQRLIVQKDEFMSIASHELKTPITSIKGYIQLTQKSLKPEEKPFSYLSKASLQIKRLEKLVADLLDVTKISEGKMSYENKEFNFGEALKESIDTVQQLTETHQIICTNAVDVSFTGDRVRIDQVIINFLTNAIKYSPGANKIIVNSEIKQNNIVVSIQDFGIGIEHEHINKLFERFYRVENTSAKFQGLGLGLYISSEILKRHQGNFWIESTPGKGSTFFFLLPLNNVQDTPELPEDKSNYEDRYITIKYNKNHHWLETDWLGFQNFHSVQSRGMLLLELFKINKCSKLLNDNSHVLGSWSEASDWAREEWLPMMEKAGLKHMAWILSPSTFSSLSGLKSAEDLDSRALVKFFNNAEDAVGWLKEV